MEAEIEFGFDRREMSHLANYDIYLDSLITAQRQSDNFQSQKDNNHTTSFGSMEGPVPVQKQLE